MQESLIKAKVLKNIKAFVTYLTEDRKDIIVSLSLIHI